MPGAYAQERSIPKVPSCRASQIRLTFNGQLLRGYGTKSAVAFPAVSGKRDEHGRFDYSSERQKISYAGPIPEGEYWIQISELWQNNWIKSVIRTPRSSWGNFRLAIHPYPTTSTHQRGGFFIHGGTTPGSAGCIDLTSGMDSFIKQLQEELRGQPECYIPLIVRYPAH
jgi:hypothetical protein